MDDLNEKIKRVFADLEIRCAYNMPSFWANGGKDYKVIPTRYAKGYQKALEDAEREITEVLSEQPEHTETHSCDYERTGTHDWIPVTERQPNHELAIVQFSDGDFSLLQFPTAYRWKDIVAWFPLPEPYKEGQDEQAD